MSETPQQIAKSLQAEVNKHGHAFQYAVIRHADHLFNERQSLWRAPVPEFPIEIQGASGRIDAILQRQESTLFLIIEAKRSNPALSNWCFLRAPYPDDRRSRTVVAETIHLDRPGRFFTSIDKTWTAQDVFHLAYEVKTSAPGDPHSKGRGGIERAVTQVLRGLNGVIDFLATNPQFLKKHGEMTFLPVVVTTASLYSSSADLAHTEIESGEAIIESDSIREKDWLFYNYPQSPGIKHAVPSRPKFDDFRKIMANEYVRSIAIVNQEGLSHFLTSGMWM